MKRRDVSFLLIGFLLVVLPALAQDDGDIAIEFPPPVFGVRGTVAVTGTVNPPDLQSYFLEVAVYDPDVPEAQAQWTPVSLPRSEPVDDDVIAQWDTTLFEDGVYRLRLRVVLTTGEVWMLTVEPLRIANELEIPEGQLAEPEPTEPPPPTEPPAPPTPVPTPTVVPRPVVTNDLPIPLGGHISNFSDTTVEFARRAGMTWLKWQIPFIVDDNSLLDVARDRISWTHERGFLAFLSIKGDKDELAQMGGEAYYPRYAEFVGQVAAFSPDAIQVWNEMNLDREWPQGQINPREYVELLRQSYEAIKAVDPSIRVVTGAPAPTGAEGFFGLARVWNDDRYYLGMANAGAADYSDCIGIHYNEGIIPPRQQGGDPRGGYPTYYLPLMIQRAQFPFRNTDARFCFSELGYLSPEGYGRLPEGFAWAQNTSVAEQAQWLQEAIQIAAQSGAPIDLIIIWNLDFSNFEDDPQAGYAIIRPDGTCPACDAIAALRGT